jgi:hypothetical protein
MLVLTMCVYGSHGEMTVVHNSRQWETWSSGSFDGSRSLGHVWVYGVWSSVLGWEMGLDIEISGKSKVRNLIKALGLNYTCIYGLGPFVSANRKRIQAACPES